MLLVPLFSQTPPPVVDDPSTQAELTFSVVSVTTEHDGHVYDSSTSLQARWSAMDHLDVVSITAQSDEADEPIHAWDVGSDSTELTLTGLRSATDYTLTLTACEDLICTNPVELTQQASTGEEYWQIHGEGSSYETVTNLTSWGVAATYMLPVLGGDRGLLFFYPEQDDGTSTIRLKSIIVDSGDIDDIIESLEQAESFEIYRDQDALYYSTFQAIRRSDGYSLFLEASDQEHIPGAKGQDAIQQRLISIESDGLTFSDVGECSELYTTPNACSVQLEIGVTTDGYNNDNGLTQVRQTKIGWSPEMNVWNRDEYAFAVITGADECEQTRDGLFFATWDDQWNVTKNDDGCAQMLVDAAHGPVIVSLGNNQYKLYYEYRESNLLSDAKPFHLLYATANEDGELTIDAWESQDDARDVHFLWPDGTLLADNEESGLGDHVIFMPTDDPMQQYMIMNLGGLDDSEWKAPSNGTGVAELINP